MLRARFIADLGVDRAVCIVGGLLGVAGTLLPYVIITLKPPPASEYSALSLISLGFPGTIVLLIAIVLGGGSVVFRSSRAFSFIGIGLSTMVLSDALVEWFGTAAREAWMQAIRAASESPGSVSVSTPAHDAVYGAGAYCLLIGFAALFVAYARLAGAPARPTP
ncbi:MAG TPA: hypothetical protein VHT05_10520 [Candidatus Elarobacter sp.]|jgi:hypothetical protein|nr:hypothetical protein [Candidatus Elarobacter sp.]